MAHKARMREARVSARRPTDRYKTELTVSDAGIGWNMPRMIRAPHVPNGEQIKS